MDYPDRFQMLKHACQLTPNSGMVLEFGVANGSTIRFIAEMLPSRHIYGFDSFLGLPEPWGSCPIGTFACDPPRVPSNVTLVTGMFADTLAPFLETHSDNVAFVHIDCDIYSSTKTVLDLLSPRIIAGTVIELDEYWIAPEHERRAFDEWIVRTNRICRFEANSEQQACVVIK